jgi:AraC family transcriptional regulator
MLTSSSPVDVASHCLFDRGARKPFQQPTSPGPDRRSYRATTPQERTKQELWRPDDRSPVSAIDSAVEISPAESVKRRAVAWNGMAAEIVQIDGRGRVEHRYRGPCHLLAVYEQTARCEGETMVQGLPQSTLRDLKRKLTFVPADHEYRQWQELRTLARVVYFYFDPEKMPIQSGAVRPLVPRLLFENAVLWDTALKLKALIGSAGSDNKLYFEALGTVLAHEVMHLDAWTVGTGPRVRGGLAAWQQRVVTSYMEEHLSEQIPISMLAQLVRLSPYHFCRAFKQSFGVPPHRYHNNQRIEIAKTLLANPMRSVTEVGLALGYSETSSFTAIFRKIAGLTPTFYRRSFTATDKQL